MNIMSSITQDKCRNLSEPSTGQFAISWYASISTQNNPPLLAALVIYERQLIKTSQRTPSMAPNILHSPIRPHHRPQIRRRPVYSLHSSRLVVRHLRSREYHGVAAESNGYGLL